ncbi:MAG: VirB4 family type IV secretion system protein [Bdellovibrionaceae bacterium]|nr:VirB4 family type IV secretion system protein [Pseudobdellovibrionaceae bacterium]
MIPVLENIISVEGLPVWQTSDNKLGIGFKIDPCDIETQDPIQYFERLTKFIRSLDPNVIARIQLKSENSININNEASRSTAIKTLGHIKRSVFLFVQINGEPEVIYRFRKLLKSDYKNVEIESILTVCNLVKSAGLNAAPLSEEEIKSLFIDKNEKWAKEQNHISNGKDFIGLIRLNKPKSSDISIDDVSNILSELEPPYEFSMSFQNRNRAKNELDLFRRLKQTTHEKNTPRDQVLNESLVKTISDSVTNGSSIVEYELYLLLKRDSQELLTKALQSANQAFGKLGDVGIETYGIAPCWLSTLLGNNLHVPLKELDDILPIFMPLWVKGESKLNRVSPSSLLLHREDRSIFPFNLFDKVFTVFNTLIIGTSGRGKSVLCGLLTRSLLNSENIKVIKVDVGGSHSKECLEFGGVEHKLSLNSLSGINPFEIVNETAISQEEKVMLLTQFLLVLIKESGEVSFSKSLRQEVEECVTSYISRCSFGTLQEFYELEANFPRRKLLSRWVNKGVYSKAFSPKGLVDKNPSRLNYYNFSQIFEAADEDFAQAGFAAVLLQFNLDCLRNKNTKMVFICDETPFFIKSCFDIFKLTTANVRKFGHALVLISQLSSHLIVNGDTGIIENSPQRFLLSLDGDETEYKNRFNLTTEAIDKIKKLKSRPGEFSECLFTSPLGSKKLVIKITKEEYWQTTSTKEDNEKLNLLLNHIPGLKLSEAIKCLSVV